MAITHSTTIRDGFANDVAAGVDGGAGPGQLVLKATAATVSTIPVNDPAFGASVTGVITLDVTPVPEDSSATGSGTSVNTFEFQDSVGTVVFSGAVPADLTLSKNPIDAGDTVQITSFTYTASA